MDHPTPCAWKGALAGLAGGLAASLVMNGFQAGLGTLGAAPAAKGEPSTLKAADAVAGVVDGAPVPADHRPAASAAVHYALGAALGVAYGIAVEVRPGVAAGAGTGFGLGTSLVIDEGLVPALGLGAPPLQASIGAHLYGIVSHLVFGATAEATRRAVRRVLA